jgi:hypothetical protein
MIWLTWRQSRAQTLVAAAALVVLAIVFGVTGPHLAHLYALSGLSTCRAHGDCATLTTSFLTVMKSDPVNTGLYFLGGGLLYLTPAVIGAFWGAPLITREIEAGTYRLAWNQSITRTRWLAAKLALQGLVAMLTAGVLSLIRTWWAEPIDRAGGFPAGQSQLSRFSAVVFAARGITPIGYAAFAFVLGVTAGLVIRRTVPAMALTLALFAAAQIIVPTWVRPHLVTPATSTAPVTVSLTNAVVDHNGQLTVPVRMPGAWIISNQTITTTGRVFVLPNIAACQTGTQQACNAWLSQQNLRQRITYQPADRYWVFQWYETAIYLAAGAVLAGFCLWRIHRHRLT